VIENGLKIVHFVYRAKTYETASKDYVTRLSMQKNWQCGIKNVLNASLLENSDLSSEDIVEKTCGDSKELSNISSEIRELKAQSDMF